MNSDHYAQIWKESINQDGYLDFQKFRDAISKHESTYTEIKVMALSISDDKIKNRLKNKDYKDTILSNKFILSQIFLMDSLCLITPHRNFEDLPKSSFSFHVKFILRKPYLSRDDEEFYIHENPISKEKVFKVPYIRASSWKGVMRWAMLKNLIDVIPEIKDKNKRWQVAFDGRTKIVRMFGNEKEDRENVLFGKIFPELKTVDGNDVNKFNYEFLQYIVKENYVNKDGNGKGRLRFYPTFFNRIGLDVINPHDRETKAGKNPILLETVPEGTEGGLYLLYVPFDRLGEDNGSLQKEIEEDLFMLCETVKDLLIEYGISAKRTSGYGSTEIGKIVFRSELMKVYEKCADLDRLIEKLKEIIVNRKEKSCKGVKANEFT